MPWFERRSARRAHSAQLLGVVASVLLAGCGGDGTTSSDGKTPGEPGPRSTAEIATDLAPLPAELIGSWDVRGGDSVFRTTYYAPEAEKCQRLSITGVGCYTVRGVAGPGGHASEVFEWGPAGLKDGNIVFVALVAGKPSCTRERVTQAYDVSRNRIRLTSVGDNCLFQDGETERGHRAPRERRPN